MSEEINGEPVAWMVSFDAKLGGANVTDKLLIWRKCDVTNHVRKELIQKVEPLYSAPTIPEGWQPIETAPKEVSCLVVGESGNVWVAKYTYAGPRAGERWNALGLGRLPFSPTHWMPLPAAPKGETA